MGKSPDDLPLDDTPHAAPVDDRETEWYAFLQEIDELIESGQYEWALGTLQGIRETVERYRHVTLGQRQAISNIRDTKQRADGWRRRRYEGFR